MTATLMPVASCDANVDASGITQHKNDVAPLSNFLNLSKAMVPLIVLLAWCDNDASANSIKYPKVMLHITSIVLT